MVTVWFIGGLVVWVLVMACWEVGDDLLVAGDGFCGWWWYSGFCGCCFFVSLHDNEGFVVIQDVYINHKTMANRTATRFISELRPA